MLSKQEFSVLLFYYLGYSKVRNWLFRIRGQAVTTFVTFHEVPLKAKNSFKSKMVFLKKRTNVISLEDYILGKTSCEKVNTVITFDDGYQDWISNVIPVLKELALPATFFISSGFIGLSGERRADFIKSKLMIDDDLEQKIRCLSPEDLKRMADDGFTIGGHTMNHCILTKVKNQKELMFEVGEDKKNLESFTGRKVDFFSYPRGEHVSTEFDLVSILKKCGYKAAVTLISGFNKSNTEKYLLHREITGARISNRVFKARVFGNTHLVTKLKSLFNTIPNFF